MSKHTALLNADETVELCTVSRGTEMDAYLASVAIYGGGGNDFGGGTVTLQVSPDGGTTKIPLKDVGGNAVSVTSDDIYNITLGYSGKNGEELILYAVMTGSTSPTVLIAAFDNR